MIHIIVLDFKKWLNEQSISTYLLGNAPEADEYPGITRSPQTIILFRDRLKAARKLGNKLYNIDFESLEKIPIISPPGRYLPEKSWKHKSTD